MPIPAYDPRPHNLPLLPEIRAALEAILVSGQFIGGPALDAFEQAMADYLEVPVAVGVSSGTDALLCALMALEVGPDDSVLTTPFTFFATAGVVQRLGARVVFCDIEADAMTLDVARAAEQIRASRASGWPVRVVLPVHLFGQMVDCEALQAAVGEQVAVVEDAAQCIGARLRGRRAGSLGTLGCFSFYPTKNLGGIGDGGLIVSADEKHGPLLRELRNHGMSAQRYQHLRVGGNFRLDALQAEALRIKLAHLDDWTRERQRLAGLYDELFEGAGLEEFLRPPVVLPDRDHVFHQYVVRVARRDELRAALARQEIGSSVYYPQPLHLQPCFESLGYGRGDFPESERAAAEVLALPMFPGLSDAAVETVVQAVQDFFRA